MDEQEKARLKELIDEKRRLIVRLFGPAGNSFASIIEDNA